MLGPAQPAWGWGWVVTPQNPSPAPPFVPGDQPEQEELAQAQGPRAGHRQALGAAPASWPHCAVILG